MTETNRIEFKERLTRELVINACVHNDYTNEVPPVFELFSDQYQLTIIQPHSRQELREWLTANAGKQVMPKIINNAEK